MQSKFVKKELLEYLDMLSSLLPKSNPNHKETDIEMSVTDMLDEIEDFN